MLAYVLNHLETEPFTAGLFGTVSEKIASRPGGYTRIIKLGKRIGDNAETALIELVDFNEIYGKTAAADKAPAKKTRRAGGKKKAEGEAEAPAAEAPAAE